MEIHCAEERLDEEMFVHELKSVEEYPMEGVEFDGLYPMATNREESVVSAL